MDQFVQDIHLREKKNMFNFYTTMTRKLMFQKHRQQLAKTNRHSHYIKLADSFSATVSFHCFELKTCLIRFYYRLFI